MLVLEKSARYFQTNFFMKEILSFCHFRDPSYFLKQTTDIRSFLSVHYG
jgi:hypothetical protein